MCLPTEEKLHFTDTISRYAIRYIGKISLLFWYNKYPHISMVNRTSQSIVSAAITSFVGAIILTRVLGQSSDFDHCVCRDTLQAITTKPA